MSKVDAIMSRRVASDGFIIDITLEFPTEVARLSFHLNQGTPNPIRVTNVENPLSIPTPINPDQKRQIHEWLKSFNINGLPHWTLYRDILVQIGELEIEEDILRRNHEEIEAYMTSQQPPQ